MLWIITGIIISYLIGSIPTAYLFGRFLKGVDIRECGSGNVGATNAARLLGKGHGLLVLILDILKGFAVVLFLGNLFSWRIAFIPQEISRFIFGLSCIFGHNWTIFLNFKGGKGVATSLGVLLGLTLSIKTLWFILFLSLATWGTVFIFTRIVSLASVLAALSLPLYTFIFSRSVKLLFLSLLLSVFTLLRHKPNIQRLMQGKEKRFSTRKTASD